MNGWVIWQILNIVLFKLAILQYKADVDREFAGISVTHPYMENADATFLGVLLSDFPIFWLGNEKIGNPFSA